MEWKIFRKRLEWIKVRELLNKVGIKGIVVRIYFRLFSGKMLRVGVVLLDRRRVRELGGKKKGYF